MNQGVWVDVARKFHLLISQELHSDQVSHGVVLLVDRQCPRIRHFFVGAVFPVASKGGKEGGMEGRREGVSLCCTS